MEQSKFNIMQLALEVFRIESQRNQTLGFFDVYKAIMKEIYGEPKRDSKPNAEEFFRNKNLGVDSKTPDMREMEGADVESFNMKTK